MVAKICTYRLVQTYKTTTTTFWVNFWRKSRHGRHLLHPSNSLLDPQLARTFSTIWVCHKNCTPTHTIKSTSSCTWNGVSWGKRGSLECKKGHSFKALHCEACGKKNQPKTQSSAGEWPITAHRELLSTSGLLSIFIGKAEANINMENTIFIHVKASSDYLFVQNQKSSSVYNRNPKLRHSSFKRRNLDLKTKNPKKLPT